MPPTVNAKGMLAAIRPDWACAEEVSNNKTASEDADRMLVMPFISFSKVVARYSSSSAAIADGFLGNRVLPDSGWSGVVLGLLSKTARRASPSKWKVTSNRARNNEATPKKSRNHDAQPARANRGCPMSRVLRDTLQVRADVGLTVLSAELPVCCCHPERSPKSKDPGTLSGIGIASGCFHSAARVTCLALSVSGRLHVRRSRADCG